MIFQNRRDAGKRLALELDHYRGTANMVVLALPRGGVPVAFEVAEALNVPLDVFLVRKLGVPRHEELAMGAIAAGGIRVLNDDVVDSLGLSEATIDAVAAREEKELERRHQIYGGSRSIELSGKTAIVVDDGLATGSTMRAAVAAIKSMQAARIVVAVPVAAEVTCEELRGEVDEVVCLSTPHPFQAVGYWYHDFGETSDEEIIELLHREPGKCTG